THTHRHTRTGTPTRTHAQTNTHTHTHKPKTRSKEAVLSLKECIWTGERHQPPQQPDHLGLANGAVITANHASNGQTTVMHEDVCVACAPCATGRLKTPQRFPH